MADIVSPSKRSQMMAGIRAKNTKPELLVRRALHDRGFRFRLHRTDLAGKPDLYFPKFKSAVFVHGCFWHAHDCKLFKLPRTNTEFWEEKLMANRKRDQRNLINLETQGVRSIVIWECETRSTPDAFATRMDEVARWLRSAQI